MTQDKLSQALQRESGSEWTLAWVGIGKENSGHIDCRDESIEEVSAIVKAARYNTPAAPDADALEDFETLIRQLKYPYQVRKEIERIRAALQSQAPSVVKPPLGNAPKWVNCPICHEPDMRMSTTAEGETLIHCVNHGCRSNTVAPSVDDAERKYAAEAWNEAKERQSRYLKENRVFCFKPSEMKSIERALLSGTAKKVGE